MIKSFKFLALSAVTLLSLSALAEPATSPCTLEMTLSGTIGPASLDLFERAQTRAADRGCTSIFMLVNTPGGSLQTTRLLVEKILNSPVPILCLVAPAGAHAGSAGAIILEACHVNGAMEATNLGAATPISGSGEQMPEDLRKKILNDTRSWMEGITKLRGRSEKFGRDIILEAKAVSADEALKIGAIDTVVSESAKFLDFAQGRKVRMSESREQEVAVGPLVRFDPDLRFRTLDLLTDPQTAYLTLMGSIALIYFEITHPGTMVAGVLGGIGMVISLIALHKLNVEWGGLLLMLIGIGLLIAEAFVPSFGILGVGGIAAFVIGSLFLFDPVATGGYQLPLSVILPTVFIVGSAMLGVALLVFRTRRVQKRGGYDSLLGETGVVVSLDEGSPRAGQLEVDGETWRFECGVDVALKQKVVIESYKRLTLKVRPAEE